MTRRSFLAASATAAGAIAVPSVWTRVVRAQDAGKPELKPVPDNELEQMAQALPAEGDGQAEAASANLGLLPV